MKDIVMPKEGTLFSDNKNKKLDFVAEGNFVNVIVYDRVKMMNYGWVSAHSYKVNAKCIFNKLQFEGFLFTNGWFDEPINITFES